jgi:hypothetical protein
MYIPPLDTRRKLFLGPFLCHYLVLLALILGQLLLNLPGDFLVGAEVLWRSSFVPLNRQLMDCIAMHGGHNVKVCPSSDFEY